MTAWLHAACFLRRVTQPLRAAAERCSNEPDLWARPPRDEETWVSGLPRPDPDLFPPPDSLFTVAQARALACFRGTPLFSYPFSICRALRFCLSV